MYISTLISRLAIFAILSGGYFIFLKNNVSDEYLIILDKIYYFLVITTVLNILLSPLFRFKTYRYKINEDEIRIKKGFFWKSIEIAPINRLYQMVLKQNLVENLFNFNWF